MREVAAIIFLSLLAGCYFSGSVSSSGVSFRSSRRVCYDYFEKLERACAEEGCSQEKMEQLVIAQSKCQ